MYKKEVPVHVGIIMDGNRRWAKSNNKTTFEGHLAGANRIIELSKYIFKKGISYLSIYAFSTENFGRSNQEVRYLLDLIIKIFTERFNELDKENIKIIISGKREGFPDNVLKSIDKVVDKTKNNSNGILNICLNYGSRAEIVETANKLARAGIEINEDNFSKHFFQDLPDLDFIIRTSGEQRLSNFMLWQACYAEFYFPETLFPDFNELEFDKALEEYSKRQRRFGGN